MIRALRILSLALLLGSLLGEGLMPRTPTCEETKECCPSDGACDANCLTCACCASRVTEVMVATTIDPLASPQTHAGVRSTTRPLIPPPTDILHVPKSIA
jgi:hypothetical protein